MPVHGIDEGRDWNEPAWEMTPLSPRTTGLRTRVFVATKCAAAGKVPVLRVSANTDRTQLGDWVGVTIPYRCKPLVVTPLPEGLTSDDVSKAQSG